MKSLILFFALFPAWALAQGGSGVKGGDFLSQGFAARLKALPALIEAKGPAAFPEIDVQRLRETVNDPSLRVELSSGPLTVEGVPKDAWASRESKLVTIDGSAIKHMLATPGGEVRVDALALHEALVLMTVEGNGDYHVSNRLLVDIREGLLCSTSKFESPAGSPGTVTTSMIYGFQRQYNNCHYSINGGSCSLSSRPLPREAGASGLQTSHLTSYYEKVPTQIVVQQGAQIEALSLAGVSSGWFFSDRVTYSIRGRGGSGRLEIRWRDRVTNSLGHQVSKGTLLLPASRSSSEMTVYCKQDGS
ncbi:MAG TPA: hypothetical protein VM598_14490 [Bdellovibrionota bacterium]|nr:hypothetical protein [Bdellovibrionota bacterium]